MAKQAVRRKRTGAAKVPIEEVASLERRLHAKIDAHARLEKVSAEYKWDQLHAKISQNENRLREMTERYSRLKGYFEGLVSMVVAQNTRIDKILGKLDDHNRGINLFESRN